MSKKTINKKVATDAALEKQKRLSEHEEIRGVDLLESFPIIKDDGINRFCRMQDFVLFAYADNEKRERMMKNWKKNANRTAGGPNPHSTAIKATRACIINGNKEAAFKERAELRKQLQGLDEKKKRFKQKSIDDLTKFIEHFRDDIIRTPRKREHRPLRNHQKAFRFNNISLTYNPRNVTVFHSNHEGKSCFGGVCLHVTDTSPFSQEQREMMAYLMQLLLETNFKEEKDEVIADFCHMVDVPGKTVGQSPANSKRIRKRLVQAADAFAQLWDNTPES